MHFSVGEWDCHCGTPYPIGMVDDDDSERRTWFVTRLYPLCVMLEELRTELGGRRFHITSGYRTPIYNLKIGGAKRSQHCAGRAADIEVEGLAPSDVYAAAIRLYKAGHIELGGAGLYDNWCHFDVRPSKGNLAQWRGAGIGSEMT